MKTYKLSQLIQDFDFYPRPDVDSSHTAQMERAIRLGVELPPIVIEKKTKRIVDGFHRKRAYGNIYGQDYAVECVEKTYKSDAEFFKDVCKYNAGHGRPLTPFDKSKCLIIAQRLRISDDEMSVALCVDLDYIGSLRATKQASVGAKGSGRFVPLKNTARHMAGKTLTPKQEEANKHLTGLNQMTYISQLITLLEADLIDMENERVMDGLKKLHDLLETLLVAG